MSRGLPQPKSQSARRILERCQNRINSDDAIIIDDDTENADVVQIDNPSTYQGSKDANTTGLSYAPGGVIYIDDEEEDPKNSSTDATISNQFAETFCSLSLSENSDGDSYYMFVRNGNVCCDHTGTSRNRYAVDLDSENSMTQSTSPKSNSDECDECISSDCEIMEDHSGIIREQWEKAASRKKESCQFASTDQSIPPDSTFYAEDPSYGTNLHDADIANCFERMPSNCFEEMLAETSISVEQDPSAKIDSTYKNEDFHFKTTNNIFVEQSSSSSHIPFKKPANWREDDDSNLEEYPQTAHSMNDGLSFLNKDAPPPTKYSFVPCKSLGKTKFFEKEEHSTRRSYASFKWDGKQVSENNDLCSDKVEHKLDEVVFGAEAKHEMVVEREASDFKENKKREFEESLPFCSQQHEEQPIKTQSSTFNADMDYKKTNKEDKIFATTDIRFTTHELDDMPHGIESLIGDRERHKKTDEYKRVVEEEWASRQRQLQIQAEEAQRLRKRRKAENMRLLDMEKRQKQRLEEVRDLQKKDEETIQLKERIRTEVRKDLETLEMNCRDMASVLRALGIHVKGGFIPTVHEINAAYKQALLRFHPDRASRTDIRQQVVAEEKFKLISRLKEKLSPI